MPGHSAPRMSIACKRFVFRLVVAGETNNAIRQAMHDAGYQTVSDQTLSAFRRRDYVKAAIERRDAEAVQQGYGQFGARLRLLSRQAVRLEKRLTYNPADEEFATGKAFDTAVLSAELRQTVGAIESMVGRAEKSRIDAAKLSGPSESEGAGAGFGGVIELPGNGKVNDNRLPSSTGSAD